MDERLENLRELAGVKLPDDEFFVEGNKSISQFSQKFGIFEIDNEDFLHEAVRTFDCNIHGCNQKFDTVFLFEQHYNICHRFVCAECKKTLASPHLLDLHVAETHDSFFAAQAERKPMCYTQECKLVFQSQQLRKDHCIKDHEYPNRFWADKLVMPSKKHEKPKISAEPMEQDTIPKKKKGKYLGHASRGRQQIFVNFSKDLSESLPKL